MSMQDLLNYARDKKSDALNAAIVTYSGIDYNVIDLTTTGLLSIYVDCLVENGIGTRSVLLPGNPSPVSLTNTQFISIMRSAVEMTQMMADVYSAIVQQILALTITTNGQIDTAWTSGISGYSSNRVVQPTIEALYALINAIPIYTAPTLNKPTRTIITNASAANGFQISTTKSVISAKYDIIFSTTATIGGASSATVILEAAPTNSSNPADYVKYGYINNAQTITLAIILQSVQGLAVPLIGNGIPAGHWVRLRLVTSGTASASVDGSYEYY